MTKHDSKERDKTQDQRSGNDFNREDSNHSGYSQFVKDRRPRTHSVERIERRPREEGGSNQDQAARQERYSGSRDNNSRSNADSRFNSVNYHERQGEDRPRRSFNPNFDRDNRPAGQQTPPQRGEWKPRERNDNNDKPYGQRNDWKPRTEGQNRPYGGGDRQPNGDRDRQWKPREGDRPYGNRQGQRNDWKPRTEGQNRPYGGGDRQPNGDRDRQWKPREGDRPYGNRQGQSSGDRKPYRQNSDRPSYAPRYDKDNYPRFAAPATDKPVRLNRFVAMSGLCSRREADDFIIAGVVSINGKVITELGTKVMPGDEVRFNDQVIHGEKKVYIILNKPKGFVTTIEDPHSDKTVMDLVKNACSERVYPVGRLDKSSLGVLLITNDGDMTKRLTHPSYNKKKVYQVSLDRAISQADMEQITTGIELEDGTIAADAVDYVGPGKKEVGIEIHSGRNRIVRRIFEALGYHVQKLDRVYFAGLTKQKLKRGAWRFLSPREVSMLKSGEYE